MFERVDHIGVVVDHLDRAAHLFGEMGLTLSREVRIAGRLRANFYSCGNVEIELIEIDEPTERARRLGAATARIEHIAVEVADMDRTLVALSKLGVEGATPKPARLETGYSMMTDPKTSAGIVLQLLQKFQET